MFTLLQNIRTGITPPSVLSRVPRTHAGIYTDLGYENIPTFIQMNVELPRSASLSGAPEMFGIHKLLTNYCKSEWGDFRRLGRLQRWKVRRCMNLIQGNYQVGKGVAWMWRGRQKELIKIQVTSLDIDR
jgi:hypothetical protein